MQAKGKKSGGAAQPTALRDKRSPDEAKRRMKTQESSAAGVRREAAQKGPASGRLTREKEVRFLRVALLKQIERGHFAGFARRLQALGATGACAQSAPGGKTLLMSAAALGAKGDAFVAALLPLSDAEAQDDAGQTALHALALSLRGAAAMGPGQKELVRRSNWAIRDAEGQVALRVGRLPAMEPLLAKMEAAASGGSLGQGAPVEREEARFARQALAEAFDWAREPESIERLALWATPKGLGEKLAIAQKGAAAQLSRDARLWARAEARIRARLEKIEILDWLAPGGPAGQRSCPPEPTPLADAADQEAGARTAQGRRAPARL